MTQKKRTRHGKKVIENVRRVDDPHSEGEEPEEKSESSQGEDSRNEQDYSDTIGSIADDVGSALNKAKQLDLDQDDDLNDAVDILQGLKAALAEMTV